MCRRRLRTRKTFQVGRVFVRSLHAREMYRESSRWWQWRRWLKRVRAARVQRRQGEAIDVLAQRYAGVVRIVFIRMCEVADRRAGSSGLRTFGNTVWLSVSDQARTLKDARGLSTVMWKAVLSACRADFGSDVPLSVNALKPRFMLRQFVDEMPSSDERGALITMVYGGRGERVESQEALTLVSGSYPLLHEQVLKHVDDLDVLTDSSIPADVIYQMEHPFAQYEQWLLFS